MIGKPQLWAWACFLAVVFGQPLPVSSSAYRDVVDLFATAPDDATARMLALPHDEVAKGVELATRANTDWTADALDRALLMHGDAAIALALNNSPDAARHLSIADALAMTAARKAGNEWFVHRWYKAFTARVKSSAIEDHWHQQPWYHAAGAVDRGRELEASAAGSASRPDTTVYDTSEFFEATSLFERGLSEHLLIAAVHLGRIQMLRGKDGEAKRLFESATRDATSPVTRYLAELFLGSMFERDRIFPSAEAHYKAARAALPRAQSGRFALAALLARTGRDADARRAIADAGATPFYDPWWSYFHSTARENAYIFAELHSEVCR